jgi:hypothetical protein
MHIISCTGKGNENLVVYYKKKISEDVRQYNS